MPIEPEPSGPCFILSLAAQLPAIRGPFVAVPHGPNTVEHVLSSCWLLRIWN